MGIYRIYKERCDGSSYCPVASICPAQAVKLAKENTASTMPSSLKYQINPQICQRCGKCVAACPQKAVYQET